MALSNGRLNGMLIFIVGLTLICLLFKRYHDNDLSRCKSLLEHGRWSHDLSTGSPHLEWHPAGCMKPNYKVNPHPIQTCFQDTYLIGDSSARELFTELEARWRLPGLHEDAPVHSNLSFTVEGESIDFIWDPYLNYTHLVGFRNTKSAPHAHIDQWRSPSSVVVGSGMWHARYLNDSYEKDFEADIRRLVRSRNGLRETEARPIFMPIIPPYQPFLNHERSSMLTPKRITRMNQLLYNLSAEHHVDMMLATLPAIRDQPSAYEEDGLHHKRIISTMQLEVLTARLCPRAYDHSCCSRSMDFSFGQMLAVTVAALLAIICLMMNRGSSSLIGAVGMISLTVCYCLFADRTTLFEKATKLIDEHLFIAFCYIALVCGLLTIVRCHEDDGQTWADTILPRQQTEEWKGWMQVVILLYHFFGMSQTLWVYRLIRLMVASYLFLTGFGHTSYFIRTGDFSLRRLTAVLVRINLLSCTLSFIMGTFYQLYYFPLLASVWFVVTWATIPRTPPEGVRLSIATVALVCSMSIFGLLSTVWLVDGFFALLFHVGMITLDFKEYSFRISLDFYAPYVGMLFAFVVAVAAERRSQFEFLHLHQLRAKQYLWIAASCALLGYFTFASFLGDKQMFNRYHPYLSPIPIIGFVVLRNGTSVLRSHYSRFFAWFGRHSLETFVLQYHIWLAADTHGILHLGIIDSRWSERSTKGSWRFWTEVCMLTAVFLWACKAAAKATGIIVDSIAPKQVDEGWDPEKNMAQPVWGSMPEAIRKNLPEVSEDRKLHGKVTVLFISLWLINAWWPK